MAGESGIIVELRSLEDRTLVNGFGGDAAVEVSPGLFEIAVSESLTSGFYDAWVKQDDDFLDSDLVHIEGTGTYVVGDYRARMDAPVSGAGSSSGGGDIRLDVTVSHDGSPLSGVESWVSTDNPYSENGIAAGPLFTNDAGVVTFYLDADVEYFLWRDKSGYSIETPVRIRYSSEDETWQKWNGDDFEDWSD